MSKRYLNIALVGHVANGKTTLVNALTSVDTKKNSQEIKSGKTINLGYANCVLWKCNSCFHVHPTGQLDPKYAYGRWCAKCSYEMEIEHYISFVDAPGHHSYIHTMVKGAAVIDGAILVTDVRTDTLELQTLEHLAILTVLGIKNIIVVQNKVDLVNADQCFKHYTMLQKELKGTAAEKSVIIPISAQCGKNIDNLLFHLSEMCSNIVPKKSKYNVISIIRSFNVNKPNTDIKDLKGGVVGGTVRGDIEYKIGDVLEIRPNVNGEKLTTRIESIFSEKLEFKHMIPGGLYGIGTNLDSLITKADALSGYLMGFSQDLPEVKEELDMKVVYLNLHEHTDAHRIKVGLIYMIIIGSVCVKAVAAKCKCESRTNCKKHFIMKLFKPLCTIEDKCFIYSQESSNTQLMAFGNLNDEEKREEKREEKSEEKSEEKARDKEKETNEYLHMTRNIQKDDNPKLIIPAPVLVKENRNVIWTNILIFAQAIKRTPEQVSKFIKDEFLTDVSICSNGLRVFKLNTSQAKFQSVCSKYIRQYVQCKQCKSIVTTDLKCLSCGASVREI